MFDVHKVEIEWGGRTLSLETGKIARQADGAVLARYGDTVVLCTAVYQREPKPGVDFFPLTVNYQEKAFAAGKIPGGFFKREGRPSEKETLTSRLIDRPIRPLFASGFVNETQVICTVLGHDLENDPDIVAMVGASAALTLSGAPFLGPIGGARVGYVDGQYILNPVLADAADSELDLIVAGTGTGVMMVESEASELSEELMLGAVEFGHQGFQPVIDAIIKLAEKAAKEPYDLPQPPAQAESVAGRVRVPAPEARAVDRRDPGPITILERRGRFVAQPRLLVGAQQPSINNKVQRLGAARVQPQRPHQPRDAPRPVLQGFVGRTDARTRRRREVARGRRRDVSPRLRPAERLDRRLVRRRAVDGVLERLQVAVERLEDARDARLDVLALDGFEFGQALLDEEWVGHRCRVARDAALCRGCEATLEGARHAQK